VLAYFIFNGIIFAQGYFKSSANIKAKLINGPMFSIVKGDFDFNENLRSAKDEIKIEPSDGILLQISCYNRGNMIISYGDSEIHKIKTEKEKINSPEIAENIMVFQPAIEKTNKLVNENAVEIPNGSTFNLEGEKSNGIVNLWIGRSLNFSDSLKIGFYSGTFAVSLIY
jgi:hypothetical protein